MIAKQQNSNKAIVQPQFDLKIPTLGSSLRIVVVHTNSKYSEWTNVQEFLTPSETEHYSSHHRNDDLIGKVFARALLRLTLGEGDSLQASNINLQREKHGKPFCTVGPQFNIGHSAGVFCMATDSDPVGIDIEQVTNDFDVFEVAQRFFTANEFTMLKNSSDPHVNFFKLWTLKESYMKAKGLGFYLDPQAFETTIDECGTVRFWEFSKAAISPFIGRTFVSSEGYLGAVCTMTNSAPEILEINLREQQSISDSGPSSWLQLAVEHLLPDTGRKSRSVLEV